MKHKSKSKTFPKGTDYGEIIDFWTFEIDTEDREETDGVICNVIVATTSKYRITITKIEDDTRATNDLSGAGQS